MMFVKGAALGWLLCIADISYKVRKNFVMRTIDFWGYIKYIVFTGYKK